ncbi:hypothetical protein EB796_002291 [Bugula neritina]|uniref:Uncharacterized protein n=1 Tax=Bugula neritina TaxID=10212 RepID=A0A7J7KMK6_BUGNE|nr:hypothetical protein EB796_002291 [Bugula neritina]
MMMVIGLLMGEYIEDKELNGNISVYQVAPFSCALRQMEHNFPNHLRELRLIAGRIDIGLPVSQALPQLYRDDFSKKECGTFDTGYNTLSSNSEGSKSDF